MLINRHPTIVHSVAEQDARAQRLGPWRDEYLMPGVAAD